MISFEIIIPDRTDYGGIIISNSFDSPLSYLNEIAYELNKKNIYTSKILFDLLLYVGNTPERFIEAKLEESKIITDSFKYVKIPKDSIIRKYTMEYVTDKPKMLEYSILNSMQKRILEKGISI